jgi:hypothetical protein
MIAREAREARPRRRGPPPLHSASMSGHVFHPGHDEWHGLTVVVYTNGPNTVIGRWDARVGDQVRMLQCTQHEEGAADEGRDDWVARVKKFGVPNEHEALMVPGDAIEKVVHLADA